MPAEEDSELKGGRRRPAEVGDITKTAAAVRPCAGKVITGLEGLAWIARADHRPGWTCPRKFALRPTLYKLDSMTTPLPRTHQYEWADSS
jgi:hypothetical protein